MTEEQTVRTQIRLPADMHAELVESAKASGRSLNAEMIHVLAAGFSSKALEAKVAARTEEVTRALVELEAGHGRLMDYQRQLERKLREYEGEDSPSLAKLRRDLADSVK
ncbi:Arc family DNA-binding protein [Luteimonas lutimaris]|uniref:Arc-like DNA binding domain-containing protein n=1 Tax=Luteimonas lutimaris TaxID=698645 RepID=A0ABP7MR56_9GAMM